MVFGWAGLSAGESGERHIRATDGSGAVEIPDRAEAAGDRFARPGDGGAGACGDEAFLIRLLQVEEGWAEAFGQHVDPEARARWQEDLAVLNRRGICGGLDSHPAVKSDGVQT